MLVKAKILHELDKQLVQMQQKPFHNDLKISTKMAQLFFLFSLAS